MYDEPSADFPIKPLDEMTKPILEGEDHIIS